MGGLPIPPDLTGPRAGSFPVGLVHLRDTGLNSFYRKAVMNTTGLITFVTEAAVEVSNAVPFAWGAGDNLRGQIRYKVLD